MRMVMHAWPIYQEFYNLIDHLERSRETPYLGTITRFTGFFFRRHEGTGVVGDRYSRAEQSRRPKSGAFSRKKRDA